MVSSTLSSSTYNTFLPLILNKTMNCEAYGVILWCSSSFKHIYAMAFEIIYFPNVFMWFVLYLLCVNHNISYIRQSSKILKELVVLLTDKRKMIKGSFFFFLKLLSFFLYIYLWLCWVFVSVRGLSLVAASGSHSSSRCAGLSLSRPLLLQSTGSRRAGSVVVAHRLSCSAACGICPDQGTNPCPLHWQADSQPLRHQGSPGGS